ncbi:MAG: hypothetical protein OJF60_001915 [Burkholderiaceae bacterium]|nr:MAG: hypothetical protein OJF60_001915 [Burkholderiaceae bacterium]
MERGNSAALCSRAVEMAAAALAITRAVRSQRLVDRPE